MHVALQRFFHDQDGNLTPMFALTLLPVLGLVGMTVDYSQSSAPLTKGTWLLNKVVAVLMET